MVEYCEGSGCRRKMIIESFGEQVMNYTALGIMIHVDTSGYFTLIKTGNSITMWKNVWLM